MTQDVDEELIEDIESEPGLKAALQAIGHAGMKAQDEGRCVLEFTDTDKGLQMIEVTEHVATLEGENK